MADFPMMVARAKSDPALIRDYGRPPWMLTDAELAVALGYAGTAGRDTIRRQVAKGSAPGPTMLALGALLDGWRPAGEGR